MKRWKEVSSSNQTEVSIRTKDLEMSEKSGFYDSSKLIAFSEKYQRPQAKTVKWHVKNPELEVELVPSFNDETRSQDNKQCTGKGKNQSQTRSSHFNEMLAEDANLLPDRLLSSLLSLSHRDETFADIQRCTKLAATRRNASGHTRREVPRGNTI